MKITQNNSLFTFLRLGKCTTDYFLMSCFIFLQIREQRDALEDWLDWIQEKEDVYMVTGTQASVAKNTIQIVGNTKKLT